MVENSFGHPWITLGDLRMHSARRAAVARSTLTRQRRRLTGVVCGEPASSQPSGDDATLAMSTWHGVAV